MKSKGMGDKKFQRKIENFVCEKCGFFVIGDGYTNHCPRCLWSKHVDENPGDRKNDCLGLMEPTGIGKKNGEMKVIHRCQRCRKEKLVKIGEQDEWTKILLPGQQKNWPF